MLITLLLIAAFLLTGLRAAGIGSPRVDLGWLGVSLALLALVLTRWPL